MEKRFMGFYRIDPGHRRNERRVIVIVIPETVAPSQGVCQKGGTAEKNGPLHFWICTLGLDLVWQFVRVTPGCIDTGLVDAQTGEALSAIGMTGPPVQ